MSPSHYISQQKGCWGFLQCQISECTKLTAHNSLLPLECATCMLTQPLPYITRHNHCLTPCYHRTASVDITISYIIKLLNSTTLLLTHHAALHSSWPSRPLSHHSSNPQTTTWWQKWDFKKQQGKRKTLDFKIHPNKEEHVPARNATGKEPPPAETEASSFKPFTPHKQ